MSRFSKIILAVLVAGVITAIFAENPLLRLSVRTSVPGKIIRWCLGEPGATQWVNDTVDKIMYSGETAEIEDLADRLMREFGPESPQLPKEPYSDDRALPLDRLPAKYRKLGGLFGDPDLILKVDEKGIPTAVIISWGHMRRSITIFSAPPPTLPQGFFARELNSRIYVVAGED
jgi:hypothetical protein